MTLRSISNFDSFQTILVDYLLMPIISLVMFLLIAFASTKNYGRILVGTAITTGIATGVGIISASCVYDQNIGLIDDIISIRPSFFKYWLPKFVIAGLATIAEILILGITGLIFLGKSQLILNLFFGIPFAVIISWFLGYLGSLLGIKRENPYWLTNFLAASLVILSGVIVPVAQYPLWLKIFAQIFPVSDLLNWMNGEAVFLILIIKLFIYWGVCILLTKIIFKHDH